MSYILIAIIAFLVGYTLCFKFFQDDITQGKPIVFKKGVYVASKKEIEK